MHIYCHKCMFLLCLRISMCPRAYTNVSMCASVAIYVRERQCFYVSTNIANTDILLTLMAAPSVHRGGTWHLHGHSVTSSHLPNTLSLRTRFTSTSPPSASPHILSPLALLPPAASIRGREFPFPCSSPLGSPCQMVRH